MAYENRKSFVEVSWTNKNSKSQETKIFFKTFHNINHKSEYLPWSYKFYGMHVVQ